jgi:hypothetical protein
MIKRFEARKEKNMFPGNNKKDYKLPGEQQEPPKHCPCLKQNCIEAKCELWGSMRFTQPGQLAGTVVQGEMQACVFHLIQFGIMHPAAPISFGPKG